MAASVTCRFCAATIRPPGGRAEGVTHCPWCSKDLRPAAPAAPLPPPPPPVPRRLPEPLFAAAVLAGSAGAAVAAFFAARWVAAALG